MSDDQSKGLTTAGYRWRDKGGVDQASINNPESPWCNSYSEMHGKDELVRRADVHALFKPQQHARTLEDLSRRLQAAATNPFDKEEVLSVAKEISDLADERAELLDEVQQD